MAVAWNWALFDEHVATAISKFTGATIPELAHDQADYWLDNYFLNSAIGTSFMPPAREYAFTFIRRTSAAFEEYELARAATLQFVDRRSAGEQPISIYRSALYHWEQCSALAWQAIEVWRKITKSDAFSPGDGSVEERLHHAHNRSKHTDKAIAANQMPTSGPLAMWLVNDGLRTTESLLAWVELKSVLDELGRAAELLQYPESFRDPES